MPKIELVAIDLDGTLLNSAAEIPQANLEAIRAVTERGVPVVMVSARFLYSMRPFYQTLGLTGPIICVDGAQVWSNPDGDLWAEASFSATIAHEIAAMCDARGWPLRVLVGNTVYSRQLDGQILGETAPGRVVVATNSEAIVGDPFRLLTYHTKAIDPLRALVAQRYGDQCTTQDYFNEDGSPRSLAIQHIGTSKATGLAVVLEHLGVPWDKVLALGDGGNDLPMLAKAALGVAMGNGTDAVKALAQIVAPTNDENGVAWALHRYVLNDPA